MPQAEPYLCDRPHTRFVDFSREEFVVAAPRGIIIGGKRYEQGDLVPSGALDIEALRCEYERWCRNIELRSYAARLPHLREACARRGVVLEGTEEPERGSEATAKPQEDPRPSILRDLESLNRGQLAKLCEKHSLPADGTKEQLRDRLAAILAK